MLVDIPNMASKKSFGDSAMIHTGIKNSYPVKEKVLNKNTVNSPEIFITDDNIFNTQESGA